MVSTCRFVFAVFIEFPLAIVCAVALAGLLAISVTAATAAPPPPTAATVSFAVPKQRFVCSFDSSALTETFRNGGN